MTQSAKQQGSAVLLTTILLLFFFQIITEFVEAVYLFGLLGTEIPPEIVMVLLFLSPLLLFTLRNQPSSRWINLVATIALLARAVEIILPTRSRMIVSGIGLAAFLMYFTAILSQPRSPESQHRFASRVRYALPLALFIIIFGKAWHSGSDLFAYGMFKMITWGFTLFALVLLWRSPPVQGDGIHSGKAHNGRVIAYALGITSILISLYFTFSAPNVIARWVGVSHVSVYSVLLLAWFIVGWLWLPKENISSKWIILWGLGFALMCLFSILPQQVNFPSTMDVGYPLLEPQIMPWQYLPIYLLLILSPVLLVTFVAYLKGILVEQPSIRSLAGAFGLAGGYMLIMVLAQVFTTVYDYIPVIGPFFRDKYWLVMLIPAVGSALPALLPLRTNGYEPHYPKGLRIIFSAASLTLLLMSLLGLGLMSAKPALPLNTDGLVRVFTYNVQQGYNDSGERNFDGQIDLIRSKAPDILGLQECDTARIAGGNADLVAYFADRLNMHSYYGPSPVTGTFGVALLSRYPIENARTFYLFSLGEQVAVIEADITISGRTYKVYVTHLGNQGPIFQQEQLLELMREKRNVIAVGDFNFRHYEEQYEITVAEYHDAFNHTAEKNIPDEFDIEERIDHIFVSPDIPIEYLEYLTQPESDHPALYAEISH